MSSRKKGKEKAAEPEPTRDELMKELLRLTKLATDTGSMEGAQKHAKQRKFSEDLGKFQPKLLKHIVQESKDSELHRPIKLLDLRDFGDVWRNFSRAAQDNCKTDFSSLEAKCIRELRRQERAAGSGYEDTKIKATMMARPQRLATATGRLLTEEPLDPVFEHFKEAHLEESKKFALVCNRCALVIQCQASDKHALEPRRKMVEHVWTQHGLLETKAGTRYLASDELRRAYYKEGAASSNDEAKKKKIPLEVVWINEEIKYGVKATTRIKKVFMSNGCKWLHPFPCSEPGTVSFVPRKAWAYFSHVRVWQAL